MSTQRATTPKSKSPPRSKASGVNFDKSARAQDGPPEVSRRHPDAHHGRPAKGCSCLCCWMLRRLDRRDAADHQLAEAWEQVHGHEPVDGQVRVAANASQAFREVMGALPGWQEW